MILVPWIATSWGMPPPSSCPAATSTTNALESSSHGSGAGAPGGVARPRAARACFRARKDAAASSSTGAAHVAGAGLWLAASAAGGRALNFCMLLPVGASWALCGKRRGADVCGALQRKRSGRLKCSCADHMTHEVDHSAAHQGLQQATSPAVLPLPYAALCTWMCTHACIEPWSECRDHQISDPESAI